MESLLVKALIWASVLGSGLLAGTYFAFSSFIMRALANIDTHEGINAMNAINTTILRSLFMPLFFASTFVSFVMMLLGLWYWGDDGAFELFTAGAIYFFCMFGVTAAKNVPLNDSLGSVDAKSAAGERVWNNYLAVWTRYNAVRAGACLLTFIISIGLLGRVI